MAKRKPSQDDNDDGVEDPVAPEPEPNPESLAPLPPEAEKREPERTVSELAVSESGETPQEEKARLEALLEAVNKRILELRTPWHEYPKMVNGITFNSREEQDKAGPDFADKT